jgi:DNA polymerase
MLIFAGAFDKIFTLEESRIWKLNFEALYDTLDSKTKFAAMMEEKTKTLAEDWDSGSDEVVLAQIDSLNFSIDNDIFGQYRKLARLLQEKLEIRKIKDIDDSRKDDRERLYLARATSIKFGYKDRVKAVKGEGGRTAGTSDALGGIYGNIDDGTAFTMAIYRPELYSKKKEQIETLKDEVAIFKATHPMARKASVWVNDVIRMKDLVRGRAGGLKLKMVEDIERVGVKSFKEEVRECQQCILRKTCKAPVPPSIGQKNIMILGEAPGREEDESGVGYIGKSGQALFRVLEKEGISRDDCIVANTVSCRPPNNKLPNITYASRCPWAMKAIEKYKPKFILATGNAPLYFLKRLNKGIMEWSGKTEWNNRVGAWVTYCIHPASVLYHAENLPKLKQAVSEFARVINKFR